MQKALALFLPLLALLVAFSSCASHSHDLTCVNNDPFYQKEEGNGSSGKKTVLDRIYQLDPGQRLLKVSTSLYTNPPRRVAILPFENLEGGDFILNGRPFTHRKEEKKKAWNWTYSNRLRRFLFAYLSLREFDLQGMLETDIILKELDITNPKSLYNTPPQDLGRAMGVDALIYGKVTRYRAHYYLLFTQVQVGLYVRCVSARDGSTLFEISEIRRDNNFRVATNPIDFVAASVQNTMGLRDLYVARAADEVCREMVSRIPVIEALKQEKERHLKSLVASSRNVRSVKERLANGKEQDYVTDGGGIGFTPDNIPSTASIKKDTPPARTHRVQKGDTLFKLAREYYNDTSRWRGIYKANQAVLPNEYSLTPGQLLHIP